MSPAFIFYNYLSILRKLKPVFRNMEENMQGLKLVNNLIKNSSTHKGEDKGNNKDPSWGDIVNTINDDTVYRTIPPLFPPNFSPVAQSGPRTPPPPLWHTPFPSLGRSTVFCPYLSLMQGSPFRSCDSGRVGGMNGLQTGRNSLGAAPGQHAKVF